VVLGHEDVAWQVARAAACLEAGDLAEARRAIAPALDQPPADPAEANLLGLLHFLRGQAGSARDVYLRALGRWGEWPALLFNMGVCDLKLGVVGEARSYLERLVSIRPRHRRAWTCLAVAYRRMGDEELARNAIVRARAIAEGTAQVDRPARPWAPGVDVGPARTPGGTTAARRAEATYEEAARDFLSISERSREGASISTAGATSHEVPFRDGSRMDQAMDSAEELLAPPSQPSLVDAQLAFIPRSVPAGLPREVRLPWFASHLVAAVLAAAAGFALAQGLARRSTPRSASLPQVRPPAPRHHESGTLREAPAELRTIASEDAGAVPGSSRSNPGTDIAALTGLLRTPESARGHRVFVDGRVRGGAGDPIRLPCGPHEVRVGSAGRKQQIRLPCGGEIDVEP